MSTRPPSLALRLAVACLGVLAMAPTVGDVGGCGTEATLLDEASFSGARKDMDCRRCTDCGLGSERCARACDPAQPADIVVPPSCRPLLRDGQVCLRALAAASCDDYGAYVDDAAPTTPSECRFCRGAAP